jgi:hypothetical protein
MLRKPNHYTSHSVQGPLDDIIADIKNDILESPPHCTAYPSLLDWTNPLKAPPTWAVTPLPVSRAPRDQPLNIRKNRNSRSSTSGSSLGNPTSCSRNVSQEDKRSRSNVGALLFAEATPWPALDVVMPHRPTDAAHGSNLASHTEHMGAQRSLENTIDRADRSGELARQRRPSRMRLFTNGFPRLRRTSTGETGASTEGASNSTFQTTAPAPPIEDEESISYQDLREPSDEAVDAYMRRNAHK